MQKQISNSIFEYSLSDELAEDWFVSKQVADKIFNYFRDSPLFLWQDIHNCEDRAEAIAILLLNWGIPHYKAWVFSSYYLKNENGSLHNKWNYHVCLMLPVKDAATGNLDCYVIDPAHSNTLQKINSWADAITMEGSSYHFIKSGHTYIFPTGIIQQENWHFRNKQNFKWTIQGLAGINGVSNTGKAAVAFKKYKIRSTLKSFTALKNAKPDFGDGFLF
jgi:hypothetical protein